MEWIYIALGGLLSGIVGAMGIGGGGILIVFLTLLMNVNQLSAQGINLLFFIPIAIVSVIIYCKKGLIKLKELWYIVVPGLIGAAIGTPVGSLIGSDTLSKIFGGVLILISLKELFTKEKSQEKS